MDRDRQRREVDANYDAFQRILATLLPEHRHRYALLRSGEIVDFFDRPGAAYDAAQSRFADGIFSIQEVTDEPLHLGLWSVA